MECLKPIINHCKDKSEKENKLLNGMLYDLDKTDYQLVMISTCNRLRN